MYSDAIYLSIKRRGYLKKDFSSQKWANNFTSRRKTLT